MWTEIVVAVLALLGTLAGAYLANRKSAALVAYRVEQLEKKVDKHNQVVDRTYKLEKRVDVLETKEADTERLLDEKIKVANHRIEDLEREEQT